MTARPAACAVLAALALSLGSGAPLLTGGAHADAVGLPHLAAVLAVVRALDPEARCVEPSPVRATCRWTHPTPRRAYDLHLVYDGAARTVYAYVARIARAPAGAPDTPGRLAEMMAWNGRWLVGKLEWNPLDGEVRLSAVLPAADTFDPGALRATLLTLARLAERHGPVLAAGAPERPQPLGGGTPGGDGAPPG